MDREILQMIVDTNLASIADLEARYSTSTRPAWVGEEIGFLYVRVEIAQAKLKEMANAS